MSFFTLWFVFLAAFHQCVLLLNASSVPHTSIQPHASSLAHENVIDEQLYSRQLFVYGTSAQKSLLHSHVLVIGCSPLTVEIVKNLALGGIGMISIYQKDVDSKLDLLGNHETISSYARALNPNIQIQDISSCSLVSKISSESYSAIACIDCNFAQFKDINLLCRSMQTKFVGSRVQGVCGLIFNDFLDNFDVIDADGESTKEIPLLSAELQTSVLTSSTSTVLIKVRSIDEERLMLGIGDFCEIRWIQNNTAHASTFPVTSVIDTHAVELLTTSMEEAQEIIRCIQSGKSTITKIKKSFSLNHQTLKAQLRSPSFVSCNGCLSDKTDGALSSCLLACFKAFDHYYEASYSNLLDDTHSTLHGLSHATPDHSSALLFRNTVIAKLIGMDIKDPMETIRNGGVSANLLNFTSFNFYKSSKDQGQCLATVSVIGALTSQEIIKAVTHIHTPVSQFLMFESLDSLSPIQETASETTRERELSITEPINTEVIARARTELRTGSKTHTEAVYGSDLARELARLKVFVVGAGAIGCELLKTFALIGIGEGDRAGSDPSSLLTSRDILRDISQGGIVVTDMDHIERSNLNRQLLFREKHIGLSKAEVAAEVITELNPNIIVRSISQKISPDTEDDIFHSFFWESFDIVTTALDNIEARRYVDSQCVLYKKCLLDSGTLGTKGNTQVVIPYASESYSSTADPPEDAIPMCTLKSFPYQSDHCIAWARSVFDQLFVNNIRVVKQCIELSQNEINNTGKISEILSALSMDDSENILETVSHLPLSPDDAIKWSLNLYQKFFVKDIESLLEKHPADETDEDGNLFWSGSRRRPTSMHAFIGLDLTQSEFFVASAHLKSRLFGFNYSVIDCQNALNRMVASGSIDDIIISQSNLKFASENISSQEFSQNEIIELIIQSLQNIDIDMLNQLSSYIHFEDFEKDDLSLGHVDFVAHASNLRCRAYDLPEVSRLEVQKVAGRIVPALATTTALVAGLVTLEIVKLAGERQILKKKYLSSDKLNEYQKSVTHKELESHRMFSRQWLTNKFERSRREIYHKLIESHSSSGGSDSGYPSEEKRESVADSRKSFSTFAYSDSLTDIYRLENEKGKERILKRFRNSFVNVARPMLAFAQVVEAEVFRAGSVPFTIWDSVEAPADYDIDSLDIYTLEEYLAEQYKVKLQSISLDDIMIYADFMQIGDNNTIEGENSKSIRRLIESALESEEDMELEEDHGDNSRGLSSNSVPKIRKILESKKFVDLDIICSSLQNDDVDVRMPPLRVRIKP